MAELIDRAALMSSKFDCTVMTNADGTEAYLKWVDVANHINSFPAVDAVEVVRCGECFHWKKDFIGCDENVGRCSIANYLVGAVGYCVYGERREDDG